MYAHIDGNNFYCSCERLFQPALRDLPLVVLSNNDGCIIARSEEAKRLGIPMGAPLFKFRHLVRRHNIQLRSPNFTLYGEMSARMMNTIATLAPAIEVYSIDEAFIDLRGIDHRDLAEWAGRLRRRVARWVGIPTAVGVAPTKTLAKLANHMAKRGGRTAMLLTDAERRAALADHALADIWGIGHRTLIKLREMGIATLPAFVATDPAWVRRHFGVVGMRLWLELNGRSALPIEEHSTRKSVSFSRTFAESIGDYQLLERVIASFIAICARKLRQQRQVAGLLHIFVRSDRFRSELPQQSAGNVVTLSPPTGDTAPLLAASRTLLRRLWSPAIAYKRAGILLSNIQADSACQPLLFGGAPDNRQLYAAVDALNTRHGSGTVKLGAEGIDGSGWAPKRQHIGTIPANDFCHIAVG